MLCPLTNFETIPINIKFVVYVFKLKPQKKKTETTSNRPEVKLHLFKTDAISQSRWQMRLSKTSQLTLTEAKAYVNTPNEYKPEWAASQSRRAAACLYVGSLASVYGKCPWKHLMHLKTPTVNAIFSLSDLLTHLGSCSV